jgi:hypothetical protein
MSTRLSRYATATRSNAWVAWLPLVFVAAMLFWTVALGLGGLSLMAVSALSAGDADDAPAAQGGLAPMVTEPMPGTTVTATVSPQPSNNDGIVVRLEESAEPEDVNDNAGNVHPAAAAGSDDDGTGMPSAR